MGSVEKVLPISVSNMAQFIAFLFQRSYKSSSISSIVAGLGYFHNIMSLPNPASHILIKKLLKGSKNLNDSPDIRLPVTVAILHDLVRVSARLSSSSYDKHLYSAMFTTAFHALLRVGEYTKSSTATNHALQIKNIEIVYSNNQLVKMFISIPHFKHSQRPVTLSIKANRQSSYCPVKFMHNYLQIRPVGKSPVLFISQMGQPISSYTFSKMFKECIVDLKLDVDLYKPHSLRIGGASLAHELKFSDSQIEALGRWHSTSYKRYIRVPLISAL